MKTRLLKKLVLLALLLGGAYLLAMPYDAALLLSSAPAAGGVVGNFAMFFGGDNTAAGTSVVSVTANAGLNFTGTSWTVEYWFQQSCAASAYNFGIGSSSDGMRFYIADGGNWFWQIFGMDGGPNFSGGQPSFTLSSTNHVALTYGSGNLTFWLNGTNYWQSGGHSGTVTTPTGTLEVGGGGGGGVYHDNCTTIDEVAVYAGYCKYTGNFTPSRVLTGNCQTLHLQFNEGSGTTTSNSAGPSYTGNVGTITKPVWVTGFGN